MNGEIEWPREIWMAERDDHDQGIVSAVLSEHATVARFEGDTERAREFHRYVDADIYETAERYWRARVAAAYEAAARWHNENSEHDQHGLDYSALVGIPISNAAELASSVKMHTYSADHIRALTPDDAKATLEAVRREAERAGYERGLREALNIIGDYDEASDCPSCHDTTSINEAVTALLDNPQEDET
ncbi:hypothetical protein KC887_09955 [Candidatus Kaiserbacteria bacterium]|nr:hypothetical protein [Candidatus Kaiserbacteria bacterium]